MSLAAAVVVTAALTPQDQPRFADVAAQDVLHYEISLQVDLAHERLSGAVEYTFAAIEPLSAIRLDALHSPDWQPTFRDATGHELPSDWHDDHVVLKLPAEVAAGTEVRLCAELAGRPVDGFYFQKTRHGEPIAFTDHYSIRARGWLPCEDNPTDRATFTLHALVPDGLEAVGFGTKANPAEGAPPAPAGWHRIDLASDAAIPPYMWAFVVGPLARVHEDGDPRLVDHFVYRQDLDRAKAGLVHDAEWLQTMERTFGPYAYGKYTTVQCPTRWGGFEAPGNVQLAENLFDGRDHGMSTLAHELVHMWFGDAVGYAHWREVWLSEGFASYFGPWLYAQAGGPDLPSAMRRLRVAWASSEEGRTKTIRDDRFEHPDQALNANTYPKGAWVLHMLRGELGDDAFFAALASYYQAFRNRSVTTADFVAAVEHSSGVRLGWFFQQWLDRVGAPELAVTVQDGGLRIAQTQPGEPYRFWLRLRWHDADGKTQERRVRVEQKDQREAIDGPVPDLTVDPAVELLFRPAR